MWPDPNEGIWEVRGPKRHFTHSKLMAWVAFDRALKDVEQAFSHLGPINTARNLTQREKPAAVRAEA